MFSILFRNIKKLMLGWAICVPMSCLVPKKKNLVLFMGRFQGEFFGNVKYLYLYLHRLEKGDIRYYFFTEHKSVYKTLKQNNLPVIFHPTLFSIYTLLRTNIIIVSSTAWIKKCKYHLLFRAKKVQLFHGVALKKVELAVPWRAEYNNSPRGRLDNAIRGRFLLYDLLISTSEYCTKNVFSKEFRTREFLEGGYPRNDIFFTDQPNEYASLGSDKETLSKINKLRTEGYKIILYAPTFRDTGGDAIMDGAMNSNQLSEFASKYKVVFVFKLHISTSLKYEPETYDNILQYDNTKDIQPLLKVSDVLITDYSSVCMDYLLLDRPVIFFPYDYEKYIQKDRETMFDYEWITFGPKCYSQQQLQKALADYIVDGKDDFAKRRKEIRNVIWKYKDGNASERIWDFIEERYIKT